MRGSRGAGRTRQRRESARQAGDRNRKRKVEKWMMVTYKEREGFLELGYLLLGESVGL